MTAEEVRFTPPSSAVTYHLWQIGPDVTERGDYHAGSTKRCAAAVGEGAMVVQFVHVFVARKSAVIGR